MIFKDKAKTLDSRLRGNDEQKQKPNGSQLSLGRQQAEGWMTTHTAVKNSASAGMTSKSKSQMDPSFRWDDGKRKAG